MIENVAYANELSGCQILKKDALLIFADYLNPIARKNALFAAVNKLYFCSESPYLLTSPPPLSYWQAKLPLCAKKSFEKFYGYFFSLIFMSMYVR